MHFFVYPALPAEHLYMTRMVHLLPDTDRNAPIECKLSNYDLSVGDGQSHIYEALSYCWESEDKPKSIILNGYKFSVTENLFSALQHLRDRQLPRTLWIDAICINQGTRENDIDEKNKQIPLMRKIYAQAGCVIVWLGDDREDGENALRWINHLAGQQDQSVETSIEYGWSVTSILDMEEGDSIPDAEDQNTEDPAEDDQSTRSSVEGDHSKTDSMTEHDVACSNLLQRDWFRRVWVLQEVGVARYINVLCGSTQISAHAFAEGLARLKLPEPFLSRLGPVTHLIKGAPYRPKFDFSSPGILSLGELLGMYRNYRATLQHDKIYALLGLSTDASADGLKPNYNAPWHHVFREITSHIFPGSSVQTWEDRASAVVKTKGWIMGHVGHVKSSMGEFGRQEITCHFHKSAFSLRETWPSDWMLPACAELVQEGDLICHLQGQSRPSILRLRNDHFSLLSPSLWLRSKDRIKSLSHAFDQGQLDYGHDITITWNIPMDESATKPKGLKLKQITPEVEQSLNEIELQLEIIAQVMLEFANRVLNSRTSPVKAWENTLKQCGTDVSMSEIYKLAMKVIKPKRHFDVISKEPRHIDFIDLLLKYRGESAPDIEMLRWACQDYGHSEFLDLLFKHRAESLLITEEVLKAAAQNDSEFNVIALLEHRRERLLVSEEVLKVAVGNPGSHAPGNLEILLQHAGKNLLISEEMVKSAIENPGQKSGEIVEILLKYGGKDLSISDETVRLAVGESSSNPLWIWNVLVQHRGEDLSISEEIIITAAGNSKNYAPDVLKALFKHGGEDLSIPEGAVKAAAGCRSVPHRILEVLFQHRENLPISEEAIKAAAGNAGHYPHQALKVLFQQRENLPISEEVVKAAAGNPGYFAHEALKVLFRYRENLPVSEEVVKVAVGLTGLLAPEALETLFEHGGENISISEEVIQAAARNDGDKSVQIMQILKMHRQDSAVISQAVLEAASENPKYASEMSFFLNNWHSEQSKAGDNSLGKCD
ncbi:unnamed protein product [Penicillium salamii]|uniref:Heterokaryon incompatibility domain-containing protein n=1 Tax=Penicillium salamii TaxID=1612424 RepID=A0A9W4J479_9EURO|nr:unnamed protein product [Penicillium salamii]